MPSNERFQDAASASFRVLFSLIFIVAGAGHLSDPAAISSRLQAAPLAHLALAIAPANLLVVMTGVVLLAAGLALLLGLQVRIAATALVLVLIPITLTVQVGSAAGNGPLFKNIALLGGLLHFMAHGAGAFALGSALSARARHVATGATVVISLMFGGAATTQASTLPTPTRQVLLLVQTPPQFAQALNTAEEMLAGKIAPAKSVDVLLCGPGIGQIVTGSDMAPKVVRAIKHGVRVTACGLSLGQKGIDPALVMPGVDVVHNGFVHAIERQEQGWVAVQL